MRLHRSSQLLLPPVTVEDYVGRDSLVRFIDALVDGLDLQAAGFRRGTQAIGTAGVRSRRSFEAIILGTNA